ncbi:phosphoglycolate phosphatase [Stappia sp. ES.058]|uniref:phosphoglycolate phosphatase n=1 Tax=Stappia sp. ES.058 TaxID=1881061 RepID=UPI00087A2C0F|nr:phosphoglycolate phosphatase [Stappia sp. ES.058]SDU02868.1 phosphoglycolate phosphatase [Stappia sp. ES.058]
MSIDPPISDTPRPRALLFDLDGTLVDSVPDIADAINAVLVANGFPALEVADVRKMVGNGIRKLVERAFEASGKSLEEDELTTMTARMMEVYRKGLTVATTPMPGAAAAAAWLRQRGHRLAVVTNKPEAFAREIVKHFGFETAFTVVVGGDTCATRKPDPEMLFHACRELGVAPEDAILVGDSPADIDAALAGGFPSIAVRGGYTNIAVEDLGATCVIDTLEDLADALVRVSPHPGMA